MSTSTVIARPAPRPAVVGKTSTPRPNSTPPSEDRIHQALDRLPTDEQYRERARQAAGE